MTQKTPNIRLYNTLTRRKQKFVPLEPGKVGMYTCGPTVYAYAHIGNLRAFLFEDLLKRWLQHQGYTVTHIMNITDVDDKTIKACQAQNIPLAQYTQHYTEAFFQDITATQHQTRKPLPQSHRPHPRNNHPHHHPKTKRLRIQKHRQLNLLQNQKIQKLRQTRPHQNHPTQKNTTHNHRRIHQTTTPRLRPMENPHTRRRQHLLANHPRQRQTRMAHRMQRHEHEIPRRNLRHPLWWSRQHFPTPRKRNRPIRSRNRTKNSSTTGSTTNTCSWKGRKWRKASEIITPSETSHEKGHEPAAIRYLLNPRITGSSSTSPSKP